MTYSIDSIRVSILPLGINEKDNSNKVGVNIFPNPFNSSTTIQFNSTINNGELNFYNIDGQKIKTINNISGDQIKIEKGNLSFGIYFYELKQGRENISTGKFIITN